MPSWVSTIFLGGFLKGYRTHIAGWLLIITAVAHYATGDLTLSDFAQQIPMLAAGIGVTAGRAAVQELIDLLKLGQSVVVAQKAAAHTPPVPTGPSTTQG